MNNLTEFSEPSGQVRHLSTSDRQLVLVDAGQLLQELSVYTQAWPANSREDYPDLGT